MDILVNAQHSAANAFEPSAIATAAATATATVMNNHSCGATATASTTMLLRQESKRAFWMSSHASRMRSAAVNLVVRLLLWPLIRGVTRGMQHIRELRLLSRSPMPLSRRSLANLLAYAANTMSLNLSTVQVVHRRIDPLLRLMKLRKAAAVSAIHANNHIASSTSSTPSSSCSSISTNISIPSSSLPPSPLIRNSFPDPPESCVTLNVLAAPPAGQPIRADVVFIHGLHGSLANTWKQGCWNSEGRRVNFQRPPRPPVRPPKRPRHSRGNLFDPPHEPKRTKLAQRSFSCPTSPLCSGAGGTIDRTLDALFAASTAAGNESERWPNALQRSHSEMGNYADSMGTDSEPLQLPAFRLRHEVDSETTIVSDDDDAGSEELGNNSPLAAASNSQSFSRCWPSDWLPLDCPGVRVIAVNYTTDPYLWRPLWIRKRNRTALVERAREMAELLVANGVGAGGRPIVWVGHSKGGIFIKQIMVDAWESGKAALAPLWRSARGCFFYSVPHRGSPLADINVPLVRQSVELMEIKKNNPSALDLHRRFVALYRGGHLRLQIFSFVETALTLMSVLYLRIVGIDSADPGIGEVCGVHLDHREICKPRSRNCILYTKLKKMINQVS